jgi:hypothetical protein
MKVRYTGPDPALRTVPSSFKNNFGGAAGGLIDCLDLFIS